MNQQGSRQNPNHARRPLVGVTVCFGLGILLQEEARAPFFVYSLLALAAIAAGFWLRNKPRVSVAALLAAFLFLGAVHGRARATLPAEHIFRLAPYGYRAPVLLEGTVSSDVENRRHGKSKKTIFRLEVRRVQCFGRWKKTSGEVLVNLFRDERLAYGDDVAIEGRLHRPFAPTPERPRLQTGNGRRSGRDSAPRNPTVKGAAEFSPRGSTFSASGPDRFSYREYLHRKGIDLVLSVKKQGKVEVAGRGRGNPLYARVVGFKHRLEAVLAGHFSGAALGIMQGFMLGDRYNIPEYIYELFKISGVAHILAISGFNVGIVAYVTFLFLKLFPCGRRWHYVLTILAIVFYAVLTGGQPPVVRATIMACVFLAGFLLEREAQSLNTLACAALVLLWMNPQNLFDVGFQLSFVSVLSIILIYPGLTRKEGGRPPLEHSEPRRGESVAALKALGKYIGQSFVLSASAYLGVAVLIAYYFQTVTPVALLANLVVIPLASLIVVLGLGFFLTGLALPAAAFLFAHCLNVLLALMVGAIALCVRIPGAYFRVPPFPVYAVVIFYVILGLILYFWRGDILSRGKQRIDGKPR